MNSWVNTFSHGEALALIRSPRSSTLPSRLHSNHTCAHTCTLIYMTPHTCTCVPVFTCACRETHVCAHTARVHVCAYSHVQTLTCVHQSERAALPSMLLYTLSLSFSPTPLLTSSEGSPTGVEVERSLSYHLLHIFLLCILTLVLTFQTFF